MTVWFTGSRVNVNEAVNWHLGCQASPTVQEEGAVDRTSVYAGVVLLLEATSKMDAGSRKD